MSTKRRIRYRWVPALAVSGLVALSLWVFATPVLTGQGAAPGTEKAADAAGFREFSARVQAYVRIRNKVESGLPALKPTDLPEMIAAHQEALARKIREARPDAKLGDIFTPAACESFRHATQAALGGRRLPTDIPSEAPDPDLRLGVNGIYPDTQPIAAPPPLLLAAFPQLPVEVAYRVVGRTLLLVDVKARLVVDIARLVLPPPS